MAVTIPEVTLYGQPSMTTLDSPDQASVSIFLPNAGIEYPHFLAYGFSEHYLEPCSKFWFDLDQDELSADELALLVPRQPVEIRVNGLLQCSGVIDDTPIRTGKGGSVLHIEGRDWLSYALDSQVDPSLQFQPSMTIAQLVTTALGPFGFTAILDDNAANVAVMTGGSRGLKSNARTGKTSKSALAHQIRPYPNEHCIEFVTRVCQREGLWIRPGATPGQVIITSPNYTQDPLYQFRHSTSDPSQNNIEDGEVIPSGKDQPAILFAYGTGAGGVFPHAGVRCAILNPFISADVSSWLARYPGVPTVEFSSVPAMSGRAIITDKHARPLFKEDPESHTQSEVEAFARREMSLYMRHSLGIHYDIMGHTLGGYPIAIDTMAQVEDDRSNLHGKFWVMARTFSKTPNEGTRTKVEMIIPGSIQF